MARAWHFVKRPEGAASAENFELRTVERQALAEGEVRVRNRWLSIDPITRVRMRANTVGGHPPLALGEPIGGVAVGEVIESRSPALAVGDKVKHHFGWREEAAGPAASFDKLPAIDAPEQYFMHCLGIVGLTAYVALVKVAEAVHGDTVFVSAAGGGVGSVAVQIAKKILGLRVIGSAGGQSKCDYVRALGADAVIDYRTPGRLEDKLRAAAPDGIDVYIDNVGGEHLDAALALARTHARFAICGTASTYNSSSPPELGSFVRVVYQHIRIQGFLTPRDYGAELAEYQAKMAEWLVRGDIVARETVLDGIEAAPAGFLQLFESGVAGKLLIRL